jgi:integrase/ribosomal protein L37AE/L43A
MAELTSKSSPDGIFGTKAGFNSCKLESAQGSTGNSPLCPQCSSKKVWRDGLRYLPFGEEIQRWLCRNCGLRFSDPNQLQKVKTAVETIETVDTKSLKSTQVIGTNRQICVMETKNLAQPQEIETCAGGKSLDINGKLIQFPFYCQKEGMTQSTIRTFNNAITRLAKVSDLNDSESVKEALSKMDVTQNTKVSYCVAYTVFLRFIGKTWNPPKYSFQQKLPEFLPTEAEIDQLIASSGPKVSTLLQLIKETGLRIGECMSLTWTNVDIEKRIVILSIAEKNSLPRVFKVSATLISMLASKSKENEKVFGKTTVVSATQCLITTRKRVAIKFSNPRIAKIHFHLIRHWFGTMEYHKRPDMDHVRRLLGHKSILNTQLYVNLEKVFFSESNDEYIVKVASDLEEACKLIEVGFEFVTEMDGKKIFRKRK